MEFKIEMPEEEKMKSIYLKHSAAHKKFFLGKIEDEVVIDIENIMIDINALATGWGAWDGSEYDYQWDEKFTVMSEKPGEDHKRAFFCYLKVSGHDDPLLWRQFSWGELQGFQGMMQQIPMKSINPIVLDGADEGQLPVLKYVGSVKPKEIKSTIPTFEFVKFADRPDSFQTPAWVLSEMKPGVKEEPVEKKLDDEIPF